MYQNFIALATLSEEIAENSNHAGSMSLRARFTQIPGKTNPGITTKQVATLNLRRKATHKITNKRLHS